MCINIRATQQLLGRMEGRLGANGPREKPDREAAAERSYLEANAKVTDGCCWVTAYGVVLMGTERPTALQARSSQL